MSDLSLMLTHLQSRGLVITTVYDIGAHTGEWSVKTKLACPNAEFYLFEANTDYDQILIERNFPFLSGKVLSSPGRETVEFYKNASQGDSYYKENTSWYDQKTSVQLPCTTIDQLIIDGKIPPANFIKLDTQGSELDILAGCESIINSVDLIFTECPIISYNKGSPSITDYLEYFKSKNFIPIGVFEEHLIEDTLIQLDILFMKKESKDKYLSPNNFTRPLI